MHLIFTLHNLFNKIEEKCHIEKLYPMEQP